MTDLADSNPDKRPKTTEVEVRPALRELREAAQGVYDARKQIFQIAKPETMWSKMDALGEALARVTEQEKKP